jgi:chromosome partitioning protein
MRNLITNGLKRLVRTDVRYARGDRHARILTVATVKGGVGKTTTSVNLACGLAQLENLRVLLIDLDPQGHCSTSLSASVSAQKTAIPLGDVLTRDDDIEALDAALPSGIPRLDIAPADARLAEAEAQIGQKIGREYLLRDALRITRSHYDYIIIDCPPNQGNLTLNALLAADKVLIPCDLSPLSVQGADTMLGTVLTINERLRQPLDILGVVLTRVDGRNSSMNQTMRSQIDDAWGGLLLTTQIGINTQLAKAQLAGQNIFEFAPESRGAQHYAQLTREVVEAWT